MAAKFCGGLSLIADYFENPAFLSLALLCKALLEERAR